MGTFGTAERVRHQSLTLSPWSLFPDAAILVADVVKNSNVFVCDRHH
ncbi:hypothetical protein [Nostoc sp. T09]|nr:hypothetical protein [Nostoc sp. T09]